MNQLCLTTDLTSTELASWVQAVGSIAAIFGAAWIAWFQTHRQFRNELQLQKKALDVKRAEAGRTLLKLVEKSSDAMAFVSKKLTNREVVHLVAEGQASCGLGELGRLETYLRAIPFHDLPDTLVTPALVLVSTLGQFKEKVEMILRLHRTMTAENFEDFFKTMSEMTEAVAEARGGIEKEVAPNAT